MAKKVVIDAGHGGEDWGASFNGRKEKDDNLNLAFAVGSILEANGVDVVYTRVDDVYETPYRKAMKGNEANADYFVSIHRNAANVPGSGSGVQTLVYSNGGTRSVLAENINNELVDLGFRDLGISERPNLVVLKRTKMPAVLVEAGFIDNPNDNAKFDQMFDEIAAGIAAGILDTINNN